MTYQTRAQDRHGHAIRMPVRQDRRHRGHSHNSDAVPHAQKSKHSRISIRRGQAISPIDDSLLAPNEAGLALASGGGRFSRGFKNPHNGG